MKKLAQTIERVAEGVLFFIKIVVSVLLIGCVILVVVSAAGRYFFDAPVRAQAEYMRYSLTALVFLGAVLVTWDDRHLKMDLLSSLLGGVGRMVVNTIALFGFLAAVVYTAWFSIGAAQEVGDADSLIAEIPMIYPHAILPIGLSLMAIALLLRIGTHIRHDHNKELDTLPSVTDGNDQTDGAP